MNNMKNHIIKTSILVCCLIVLTISTSYAFFSASVEEVNNKTMELNAGKFNIDFKTTSHIDNPHLFLLKPDEVAAKADHVDFTVSSTADSTVDSYYNVFLKDINMSQGLKSADFKWSLLKNGVEVYKGDFSKVTTTLMLLTTEPLTLPKTTTDSLVLRIWLQETQADQSGLYNQNFSAKIQITASA